MELLLLLLLSRGRTKLWHHLTIVTFLELHQQRAEKSISTVQIPEKCKKSVIFCSFSKQTDNVEDHEGQNYI